MPSCTKHNQLLANLRKMICAHLGQDLQTDDFSCMVEIEVDNVYN